MNMVFDSTSPDDVHPMMSRCSCKNAPNVVLDASFNERFAVLGGPNTVIEKFGKGAGHAVSLNLKRSLRDAIYDWQIRGLKPPA